MYIQYGYDFMHQLSLILTVCFTPHVEISTILLTVVSVVKQRFIYLSIYLIFALLSSLKLIALDEISYGGWFVFTKPTHPIRTNLFCHARAAMRWTKCDHWDFAAIFTWFPSSRTFLCRRLQYLQNSKTYHLFFFTKLL